tara:strand:- start:17397 stop:21308 length:3912 start_codon:yes stop_codon:yes gene_type:complete
LPTFSSLQIPPPKNWQDFESLCCDLWGEIWNDPNTQKNGRQGQRQKGVDVFGRPNQGDEWAGVQCKGKDNYSESQVTEEELKEEYKKAKRFKPQITEFILATTAPRDAKLQELARKITNRHRKRKYVVSIWSWEDIVEIIGKYPNVIAKHYPDFSHAKLLKEGLDRIEESKQLLLEEGAKNVKTILSHFDKTFSESGGMHPLLIGDISGLLAPQNEATLKYARQLIEDHKPAEALRYLESQRTTLWSHATESLKAQFINCMGAAQLRLGLEREAADSFFEARQHDEQNEKILCNCAIAYLLIGQDENAHNTAEFVLKNHPASIRAQIAYIHSSTDKSLHEIIESLPEDLLEQHEVAFALGVSAQERETLDEAIKWFRKSVEYAENPSPDSKAALANAILGSLTQVEGSGIRIGQPSAEERALLEEAKSLLDDSLDCFKEPELRRTRISYLVNRALARRILGDCEGAATDLDEALSIKPGLPIAVFQRALVAEATGDKDRAIELMGLLKRPEDLPFAPLYRAELIAERDGVDAVIDELKSFLKTSPSPELRHKANQILVHNYIIEQRYVEARKLSDEVVEVNPYDIVDLVEAARIRRGQRLPEEFLAVLSDAQRCVSDYTPTTQLWILANAYYEFEMYAQAASIYEKVSDPTTDTPNTRRLLYSCYEGDKLDRALEICHSLREANGPLQYASEIETAIYEEIGDLPKAEEVCLNYLKYFPDDDVMRVRLAVINLRRGQDNKVDEFLAKPPSLSAIPTACAIQIANLQAARGRHRESTELLYEIRRSHPNNGNVHLRYIQSIFLGGHTEKRWLGADVVSNGVAVCVEDISGDRAWYIIDDREDADISRNELQINHDLAKRLINKKLGDEVPLKSGAPEVTKGRIVEIKSKFLHACHESAAILEVNFPEIEGFVAFKFPKGEEGARMAAESIMDEVNKSSYVSQAALDVYLAGRTTIGHFSHLIGENIVDVWTRLTTHKNLSLRCCHGGEYERQQALELLEKRPKLVVDVVSLLTLHSIGAVDQIVKLYGRIGVAQSTIDVLSDILHKRVLINPNGYETVAKENEHFIRQEVTEESIKNQIEKLESLIKWIRAECDILPVTESLQTERGYVKERGKLLGEENIDTVLISKSPGHVLLSDDFLLRAIAKTELDVEGVWTQILLLHSCHNQSLERSVYDSVVVSLIELGYRHITIDSGVLTYSAQKAEWLPNEPFIAVSQRLNGYESKTDSAIGVAVNFLVELSNQPIMSFRQDAVMFQILNCLVEGRRIFPTIRKLVAAVEYRFRFNPIVAGEYISTITAWQSRKIV